MFLKEVTFHARFCVDAISILRQMIADVARAVDCPAEIVECLHKLSVFDSTHFALADIDTLLAMADRRDDRIARTHLERVKPTKNQKFTIDVMSKKSYSERRWKSTVLASSPHSTSCR